MSTGAEVASFDTVRVRRLLQYGGSDEAGATVEVDIVNTTHRIGEIERSSSTVADRLGALEARVCELESTSGAFEVPQDAIDAAVKRAISASSK